MTQKHASTSSFSLPLIAEASALQPYLLDVTFRDGRHVQYDMSEDIDIIFAYEPLKTTAGLFAQVKVDEEGTRLYWNEEIDLLSDNVYAYGVDVVE